MPRARFAGRVLPAALNISLPNQPTLHWKADELGLEMSFHVQIGNGSILIDCDLNKFDVAYLLPLFVRAHDIARASVDLAAFATGNGLTMILEEFTDPSGTITKLAAQQPSLAALATAVKLGTGDYDKVLELVLAEPALFTALRDLIEAITLPHRAAIHCARAMMTLGAAFAAPSSSHERAWTALREKLQISKSYMQKIAQHSTGPGRGDPARNPDAGSTDVVQAAWIVMNRIFEYLKRGGQPLPLLEFPLLV